MESPAQDYSLTLNNIDKDEKLLAVVTRHPFGILKLYVQVIVGLLLAGGLVMVLLPGFLPREDNPNVYVVTGIVSLVVFVFMIVLLVVATIIYFQSKLVITNGTITQTIQYGLFSRKVSQLALSSVEDVTALKTGFFPTILNFGKLVIETAGEQENFHFEYCSKADHYAKLILEARQEFLSRRELEMRQERQAYVANNPNNTAQQNVYDQQQQQPMTAQSNPELSLEQESSVSSQTAQQENEIQNNAASSQPTLPSQSQLPPQ